MSFVFSRPLGRVLALCAFALASLLPAGSAWAAVVVDRDEFSTTVDLGGGKRSTTLSSEPLNFESDSGVWQPVDLELAREGDGDLHPGAVEGDVAIPRSLSEPVELEHDGRSVTFRLLGASGDADIEGAEASFDRAMPGVDVGYVARPYGVKETLTLRSSSSPRVFAYELRGSVLWSASMDRGDVVLRDSAGVERYRISAPLAWDSAEDPAFTNALTLSVSKVGAGSWRVTLRPDSAWLSDPARTFPVLIDPDFSWSNGTTKFNGAQDCYLSGATQANNTFCAQTYLQTGWYNRPYRSIFKFDIAAAIPGNATVSAAQFKAYAPPATPHIVMGHKLHTITSDWDSTATWNNRKPGVPWTTAGGGGDISTNPAYTSSSTSVQAQSTWYSWNAPLATVQGWVNGSLPNYGFMLRSDNTTNIGNAYVWASTEASMASQFPADSTKWPKLDVTWTAPSPDTTAPQLALSGPLASLAGAWTKDASSDLTVAATDAGSGVVAVELRKGSTTLGSETQTCSGGACSLSKTFTVDLAALGEGVHTLTAVGIDAAGNARTQDLTVRVDRGPPTLTLTGTLVDQQTTPAGSGSRAVHVEASDPASGVTNLTMKVDGTQTQQATQTCAPGGCSMTADWTLDLASLSDGTHTVQITATDASGRDRSQDLTVKIDRYVMPQAPALSKTEVTPYLEQVDWLWTGSNALQTGVAPGTIEARRAAVITGNVFNEDGEPAGGVKVSVVDHPEFGSTLSRSNGKYFLGVNGGQQYRLRFEVQGAVSADREVETVWTDYAVAPDVWMVALDPKTTPVGFGTAATNMQVAEGSLVTDSDGSRRTRVLFRPGTQAWTEHTDGSLTPLLGGTFRVTEFTVGQNGPDRMPSALPNATDYTWAADFQFDESAGPNDAHVRFSKPAVVYVDNFVGDPVGMDLPNGTYNEQTGKWDGEPDGRVIKILSIDANNRAVVDVTGFGAANQEELDYLSIDAAELRWLAETYPAGKTLWRTEAVRFSSKRDQNKGRWRRKKNPPKTKPKRDPKNCNNKKGSIIGCQAQSLGEVTDLGGTPYSLRYESSRTPGAQGSRSIFVPITDDTVESDLDSVLVDVVIAGQRLSYLDDTPQPNESHIFRWDGKDAFGREMVGGAMADVTVHRIYNNSFYGEPAMLAAGGAPSTGDWEWVSPPFLNAGATVSWGIPTRGGSDGDYLTRVNASKQSTTQPVDRPNLECSPDESQCWYPVPDKSEKWKLAATRDLEDNAYSYSVPMPYADARSFGVGGWTISDVHRYDTATGTLFTGDGSSRAADEIPDVVKTVRTVNGTDNPQELRQTDGVDLDVLPDGSTLRTDPYNHRILRDDPSGHTTVFAGSADRAASSGDGGSATAASLISPQQVAVAPDGSVYVTDIAARVVRKIDSDGIITTVAGNGTNGGTYVDGSKPRSPLNRHLNEPEAIAVAPDGTVYIGDRAGLYMLTPSGDMTLIGSQYVPGCGDPKLAECLFYSPPVRHIAVAPDGTVYWSGNAGSIVTRTYRWTPGTQEPELLVAGISADDPVEGPIGASLLAPRAMEIDAQGRLWIVAQNGNESTVWRLNDDGRVVQIGLAGCRDRDNTYRYTGEGGPFRTACGETSALATGADGMYLLENNVNIQIRKVVRAIPRYPVGTRLIPSADGSEAYEFDSSGRHTATLDGLTGRITRTFAYDGRGRLSGITETDFGTTTLVYTASGATVTGPDGQQTKLEFPAEGYATKITDAAGENQTFGYATGGLMMSRSDELGRTSTFTWSAVGRLLSDTSPQGHAQTLARVEDASGSRITHAEPTGEQTVYDTGDDGNGAPVARVRQPDGTEPTATTDRSTGATTRISPDGTTVTASKSGDARWGAQVPRTSSRVRLPSGKHLSTAQSSQVGRSSSQNPSDPFDYDVIIDTDTIGTRSWTSTYTKSTRARRTTTPMGRRVDVLYDAQDRPARVTAPGRTDIEFAYDARGRLTSVTQGTASATLTYGTDGRVSASVDAVGRQTAVVRDALGQPTSVTAPDGSVTTMRWDAAGQLTQIGAPDGRTFGFTYDADGRLTGESRGARAGSGQATLSSSAQYDAADRPILATRPSGKTIATTYDGAGRASSVQANDGTSVSYAYEPVTGGRGGRLASMQTGEGASTSLTFDGPLPTRVEQSADTPAGTATGAQPPVELAWDSQLRPAGQTIAGQSVPLTYNDDDQVTAVGPLSLGYDAQTGDPTSITAVQTTTTFTVDQRGNLQSQISAAASTAVLSEQVVRDELGRIVQRTETSDAGTHVYGYAYDAASQLTQVTRDGGVIETYGYDVSGGLVSRGAGVLVSSTTTDGHGRPTSTADGTTAAWNADGELTSLSPPDGTSTFGYDGFGRLDRITLPGGRVGRYRYDALGRRTALTIDGQLVRRFVYGAGLFPQARVDAGGDVLERYIYASYEHVPDLIVRRDGQRVRLITDMLGSVRAAIDADTGAVLQRLSYDAYGRVTHDTNPGLQPFGFKGAFTDPVAEGAGLVWMGVRAYTPRLARFTTPDPIGLAAGWNEHDALAGDPINYTDADGLMPSREKVGAVANDVSDKAGHVAAVAGTATVACVVTTSPANPVCAASARIGSLASTVAVAADLVALAAGEGDVGNLALDAAGVVTGGIATAVRRSPAVLDGIADVDKFKEGVERVRDAWGNLLDWWGELYGWGKDRAELSGDECLEGTAL